MALGITQINMYCDLVKKEFEPIEKILTSRTHGLESFIETQVKKDWGIYELCAEKAAIKQRLDELDSRLREYIGFGYRDENTKLKKEVRKRLFEMNEPLVKVQAQKDCLLKQIKLSNAPKEVSSLFVKIEEEVKTLLAEVSALPAITIDGVTIEPPLIDYNEEEDAA